MIDLPETFISDISSNASTLVNDLSDYITLILGVLLAAVVITLIIRALQK